jgi:ATP-binding protein involved in chromosome partitioning
MLGLDARLESDGQKIVPAEKFGIRVVSMGFLTDATAPIIWRGPMLHGVVRQFFLDVKWGELDYLVVDMPPGTGDVALSLSQTVPVTGAVVVTTPQAVSLSDSRRAVGMYRKLNVPTLGIVENMSYYACSGCGQESDLFGRGGGERVAAELDIPFLGHIPLYAPIRVGGDTGAPIVSAEPESPAGQAFLHIAERAAAQISIQSFQPPRPAAPAAPPAMAAGPSPVRG